MTFSQADDSEVFSNFKETNLISHIDRLRNLRIFTDIRLSASFEYKMKLGNKSDIKCKQRRKTSA